MRGTSRTSQKRTEPKPIEPRASRVRQLREKADLSQEQLADLAGMHRNSIWKIENGITKEISEEHAASLASALRARPTDLGLIIRPSVAIAPRSVRFRQLSMEQRQLVDELLALPPEDYRKIRAAFERLRSAKRRKRRRRK